MERKPNERTLGKRKLLYSEVRKDILLMLDYRNISAQIDRNVSLSL